MKDWIEETVYELEAGGNGVPPFISTAGAADRIDEVTLTSSRILTRAQLLESEEGSRALAKFDAGDLSDYWTYQRLFEEAIDAASDAEERVHTFN